MAPPLRRPLRPAFPSCRHPRQRLHPHLPQRQATRRVCGLNLASSVIPLRRRRERLCRTRRPHRNSRRLLHLWSCRHRLRYHLRHLLWPWKRSRRTRRSSSCVPGRHPRRLRRRPQRRCRVQSQHPWRTVYHRPRRLPVASISHRRRRFPAPGPPLHPKCPRVKSRSSNSNPRASTLRRCLCPAAVCRRLLLRARPEFRSPRPRRLSP